MRSNGFDALARRQQGASSKGILIAIFATTFLVLAFRWRIGSLSVEPWQDQVFRGVMFIYFNVMLLIIAPALAAWMNRQDFMIKENAESEHPLWFEYLFLLLAAVVVLLLANALLTGIMPEVRRFGSGPDFNSMLHPAAYWSNFMAGYFLNLLTTTVYWQARLYRLEQSG